MTDEAERHAAVGAVGAKRNGTNGDAGLVTRPVMAEIAGLHVDRISTFSAEGMPVARHGGLGGDAEARRSLYDPVECMRWIREHRHGSQSALAERAALDRVRREELELRIGVRRGELIRAADALRTWSTLVIRARDRLRAVPTRAKAALPHLSPRDLQVLADLVDESLRELADHHAPASADIVTGGTAR